MSRRGGFPPFIIDGYFSRRYLDSTHTTVCSSPGRSPPPFFFQPFTLDNKLW